MKATWALSPEGKAGFVTSSRMGRTLLEMEDFEGRGRLRMFLRASEIRTVNILFDRERQIIP